MQENMWETNEKSMIKDQPIDAEIYHIKCFRSRFSLESPRFDETGSFRRELRRSIQCYHIPKPQLGENNQGHSSFHIGELKQVELVEQITRRG